MDQEYHSNDKTMKQEGSTKESFCQQIDGLINRQKPEKHYQTSDDGMAIRMKSMEQIERQALRLTHSANCCLSYGKCPIRIDNIIFEDINPLTELMELDFRSDSYSPFQQIWFEEEPPYQNQLVQTKNNSLNEPIKSDFTFDNQSIFQQVLLRKGFPNQNPSQKLYNQNLLEYKKQSAGQSKTHHFAKFIHSFFKKILNKKIKNQNDTKLFGVYQRFLKCQTKKQLKILFQYRPQLEQKPADQRALSKFLQLFSQIQQRQVDEMIQQKYSRYKKKQEKRKYFKEFLISIKNRELKITRYEKIYIKNL